MKTFDKLQILTGTEFLKQVQDGLVNPFPPYQRHALPSSKLVSSMEVDARVGFLAFMFPIRKGDIGDGLRRIQVMQQWNADPERATLLDNVQIVLSNYDHISRKEFIDLYVRMNESAKIHSGGDFCKAYQHLLDKNLVAFLNQDVFEEEGVWAAYTKNNAHWLYAVVIQYGLPYQTRREEILDALAKEEKDGGMKRQKRTAAATIKHLELVYKLLLALKRLRAKGTSSKWAVALMSELLDRYPTMLNLITVEDVFGAWNSYLAATKVDSTTNRNVDPTSKTEAFLSYLPQILALKKAMTV